MSTTLNTEMIKEFLHAPMKLEYGDLVVENGPNGRKYLTPEGNSYDSITTVLGSLNKNEIREWRQRVGEEEANRVSRFATGRGNALHLLMEKYLNNEKIDVNTLMPHVKNLFGQVKSVVDRNVSTIYMQEKPLYSDHLETAGRVDLVCEFASRTSIVDFKTSSRIKTRDDIENYFIQECAYSIMVEERTGIPVPRLVIIMAVDNSPNEALVFSERRDKWVPKLKEVLQTYRKNKLFDHI
jgi:genome maintenance exonuclease 1